MNKEEQKNERASQLLSEYNEGVAAKKFAENPLWIDAIEELEALYLSSIKKNTWSNKRDKYRREDVCRRIQVLDDLKNYFEIKIATGEEARKRLEKNNKAT